MNNIVLTGFMGSGKTSIGKFLSVKLKKEFIDTDKFIEEKEKLTISEIFSAKGEIYFREVEKNISNKLSQKNNIIIATGGGLIIFKENYKTFVNDKIIFLNTSFKKIKMRISNCKDRPLFNEKAYELFQKRQKIYKEHSNIIINTDDLTIEEISNIIINKINLD